MYQFKEQLDLKKKSNKVYNDNVKIKSHILYVTNENEFKYTDRWFVKARSNWIDLQGGRINYRSETNFDSDLLEEVPEE